MNEVVECMLHDHTYIEEEKCWQAYYQHEGKTFKIKYLMYIHKEYPYMDSKILSREEVNEIIFS